MDNERQQSHRGRWIMLYVMLGFVGLSIFSLADAIKNPAPVLRDVITSDDGARGVRMNDGSTWRHEFRGKDARTIMVSPPAR